MTKYQIVGKHGFPAKLVVRLPANTPVGHKDKMIVDFFGELKFEVIEGKKVIIDHEVCGWCGAIDTIILNNPETNGWDSCGACKGV